MIAVHLYLPGKFPVLTTVKFHNVRIIHWRKTTICISSVPSLNMIILSLWTLKRLKTGRCNLTKLAPFSLSGQFGVAKHPVSVHVCGTNKQGPFNHTGINTAKPSQIARFTWPTWAHLGPVGPKWAPCWPHEPCYQGCACQWIYSIYQPCWIPFRHIHIHLLVLCSLSRSTSNAKSKV